MMGTCLYSGAEMVFHAEPDAEAMLEDFADIDREGY